MMQGLSLQELSRKIQHNMASKKDFIAPSTQLSLRATDAGVMMEIDNQGMFPVRPLAHDQIGAKVGIPSKYYDRMLIEAPELLVDNVNTWMHRDPDKRMARTLEGNLRALMSNRYQRIENDDIAKVALPVLAEIPEVKIVSSEITEKRMYIQAVSPRLQGEVKRGDVVQAGVIITNSEVGYGAAVVSPLIWRLICLNGMVRADEKFRAYHVGKQIADNSELWADDTKLADDRAVLLKIRDTVKAAVDTARFNAHLDKLRGLTDGRIEGKVVDVVEVLAQRLQATETEQENILQSLIEGNDLSAWGIVNAVTAQAHSARDYDRAVEFEQMGGQLVELPVSQWKEILSADDVMPVKRRKAA
jgi:hypothetical protein